MILMKVFSLKQFILTSRFSNFLEKLFIPMCEMTTKTSLLPPSNVKGMQKLDKLAFQKVIAVPELLVDSKDIDKIMKALKTYLLKLPNLKPVQDSSDNQHFKSILLNPVEIEDFNSFPDPVKDLLHNYGITGESFKEKNITLGYENWKVDEILKAVLPDNEDGFSGYSVVGHIVHLNLREHLFQYRFLIGEVLLDKMKRVSLIVNKVNVIENKYRNFQMEILAGKGSTVTQVKENGCTFELDFAEVFWNSRLSTEHQRITDKLKADDFFYDVFAGIGPFAVPAAKKSCCVYANDLNPQAYHWLVHNCKLNKVHDRVKNYNMDGREFIKTVLKEGLIKYYKEKLTSRKFHVIMNLPELAVEFLDSFKGLLCDSEIGPEISSNCLPLIHCYSFIREDNLKDAMVESVQNVINHQLKEDTFEFFPVRHVAPKKEMVRLSFTLPTAVLCENKSETFHSLPKKPRIDI